MDFGILFLDPRMRIKRFTPRLAELFSITPSDVGRPITDLTHRLDYERLLGDIKDVLERLGMVEREVRSRDGHWYLVRIRPYRVAEDKIDGAVVTFVDITERRKLEEALRASEEKLFQEMRLVELSRAPIFVWDLDGLVLQWNRGSEELYGYSSEEALSQDNRTLLKPMVPGSSFDALKEALVRDGKWHGRLHHIAKDGRRLLVESHLALIKTGIRRTVLESTREIKPDGQKPVIQSPS
jgi:two-component system, chemotaxis family, CheB/CheR fusion protein